MGGTLAGPGTVLSKEIGRNRSCSVDGTDKNEAEDAEETKGCSWYFKHYVESIIFQPAHSISAQCLDSSPLFSQRLHTKIFTCQSYKNIVRSGL